MEATAPSQDIRAGRIVGGRYRLLALRGKGGMGSVWRALHLPDGREFALKMLHQSTPDRIAHLSQRFIREARAAARIDSPNAVRVLDYGIDEGLPFIVMEFLEGETLAERLRSRGRISAEETSEVIMQIANALTRAHELGIVHRDLKPDNVFLARSGKKCVAKVLDFGIAKVLDEEAISRDLTETGAVLGTPHYMSPEQIEGARHVDYRADLWSLSVIAFECLTGVRPFRGDGLRSLFVAICVQTPPVPSTLASVPTGFDAWFAKATNRSAEKRFESAAELAEAFRRVCDGHPFVSVQRPDEATSADAPRPADPVLTETTLADSLASGELSSHSPESAERSVLPRRSRAGDRLTRSGLVVAFATIIAFSAWRLGTSSEPDAHSSSVVQEPASAVPQASTLPTKAASSFVPSPTDYSGPDSDRHIAPVPSAISRGPRSRASQKAPPVASENHSSSPVGSAGWNVEMMLRDRK